MQAAAPAAKGSGSARADRGVEKYLSFYLGAEEYAIAVLSVREIMGMQEITAVPQTPPYVKGIINLRGKVVPVMDLRLKFGMEASPYTKRTCIVVVDVAGEGSRMLIGVVVDAVSEVLNVQPGEIEETPDFGEGVTIPYILGIAKSKGKVKMLLDIEKALTASDLSTLSAAVN